MGNHKIVVYSASAPTASERVRRRIGFTVHVAVYLLFGFGQALLLPFDWLPLTLHSLLFVTLIAHFALLHTAGAQTLAYEWLPAEIISQTVPRLPDRGREIRQDTFRHDDFWYRWHDV